MTAGCDTDSVLIWNAAGIAYTLNKGSVATIVVCCDLFIAFFLWLALVAGRPFQSASNDDVNGEIIMAEDFTVVLEVPQYLDENKDLKAVYWAWA